MKDEHVQFINQYFHLNMNATKAYLAVYGEQLDYFTAAASASRLLKNDKISAEIQKRLQAGIISADIVLQRLSEQAMNMHTDYINEDGKVDLKRLKDDGMMHLVKGTKFNARGQLIVEFYDAQKAKELLGKYHAIWTDKLKIEHTWKDDLIPLVVNGTLHYATVVDELGESLAQELFKEAGVNYE